MQVETGAHAVCAALCFTIRYIKTVRFPATGFC